MLTSKQRAHLRSLANGVDVIIHVGKNGISPMVIQQTNDALTARELVKGTVQQNSDSSVRDVADDLAHGTAAEVVQVIGRKFVLYRANLKEPKIILPD